MREYMKKILIVEDDEAIRTELITLLRANGYMPVEGGPCDLILMDINLPGESGFTRCRKLRERRMRERRSRSRRALRHRELLRVPVR